MAMIRAHSSRASLAAVARFGVVATQDEKAERFLALHQRETPLLMPNPWDVGSASIGANSVRSSFGPH